MDEDQARRHAQAERLRSGYRRTSRRRVTIVIVALFVVLGGMGAYAGYRVHQRSGPDSPKHSNGDFGFTLTAKDLVAKGKVPKVKDPVKVEVWDDFFCAECKGFNRTVSHYLRTEVEKGEIELVYHPFLVGDDGSTNNFAERAANAAACVGDAKDAKAYAAMHDLLLVHQPKSGKPGASTAQLLAWATSVGAKDVEDCIRKKEFAGWLKEAVTVGKRHDVTTAPTVTVAGIRIVSPDKAGLEGLPSRKELRFAIEKAGK